MISQYDFIILQFSYLIFIDSWLTNFYVKFHIFKFLSFYFKSHKYFNFIPKNCKFKLIFFPVCIILDCGLSLRSFCLWRSKALERLKRPVCKNCGWNISRAIAAILLCPCRVTWWHPDTSTGLWTLPTHRFTTGEKPSVAFQSPKFSFEKLNYLTYLSRIFIW